jgi:tRNA nucleotidyltransferase (CCA-adding enzyme)
MSKHTVASWHLNWEEMSVINVLEQAGAIVYVIGGTPRDLWWGISPNDIDLEVFGMAVDNLKHLLLSMGSVKEVGQEFGIFDFTSRNGRVKMQIAVPRRERQPGTASKDMVVSCDPYMTPEEASSRRDYTINSLMWRPTTAELFDFHRGIVDCDSRILRPIGPAFEEDALRPLRGFRLAAQHLLKPSNYYDPMMYRMANRFDTIPKARLRAEWEKWAKSHYPAAGLRVLDAYGWLQCFPLLFALSQTQQDPEWHPEGNAWIHSVHVVEAASTMLDESIDYPTLMWAALLHDAGKPATTVIASDGPNKGRLVSPGHDAAGVAPARAFFEQFYDAADLPMHQKVYALIRTHMRHINWQGGDAAIRRLANEVGSIKDWYALVVADHSGRPYEGDLIYPEDAVKIMQRAEELAVSDQKPQKILMGRHLLERGWKPGPAMGAVLNDAFEAQLDGHFFDLDGALAWLEQWEESAQED